MTKLIDKILPYKVIAADLIIPEQDKRLKGFTKRFAKEEKLEKYLKKRLRNETFDWNYTVDDKTNTYYVYPGRFSINKAIYRLI